MSSKLRKNVFLAALVLAGGGGLWAESAQGLELRFAFRTGVELQDNKDHLRPNVLSGGLDLGYHTSFGRLGAELGYQYKSGKQYMLGVSEMTVAQGKTIYAPSAVDSRKATLSGITLRLNYEKAFMQDFAFQGGVQLGGLKFRQEVIGTVSNGDYWTGDPMPTWVEAYNTTPTKTTVGVSPYAGLSYKVNPNFSVNVECMWLNYKAINYVHVAGNVPDGFFGKNQASDYIKSENRSLPQVQFGFTFHF